MGLAATTSQPGDTGPDRLEEIEEGLSTVARTANAAINEAREEFRQALASLVDQLNGQLNPPLASLAERLGKLEARGSPKVKTLEERVAKMEGLHLTVKDLSDRVTRVDTVCNALTTSDHWKLAEKTVVLRHDEKGRILELAKLQRK
jgi:ABC-type transporter Mla subunit MlaD